jgi:hypothetical protein
VPIIAPDDVFRDRPDAVLLLAWNFRSEIEAILRDRYAYTGKIIVPLPNDPVTCSSGR